MSSPKHDEWLENDGIETPAGEAHDELVELGKVSDTEGGILGNKPDTGMGWWYI